jgi:hypothetical protein
VHSGMTPNPDSPRGDRSGCCWSVRSAETRSLDKIAGGFGQQEFAIYDVLRARSPKVRSTVPSKPGAHTFFLSVAQASNVVNKAMADAGVLKDAVRIATTAWEQLGLRLVNKCCIWMLWLISAADLVGRKGLELSFQWLSPLMMAASRRRTLSKLPRRIACPVIMANQRSTRLSKEARLGVKCRWMLGCEASPSFTAECFVGFP